uniref:Dynein light chain n=1 Tax=Echinococcus granulosus TaxID=6210 RepID=A0A068WGJ4_ECHGR|nr:dynein light chain [Echinococcus granulosus]
MSTGRAVVKNGDMPIEMQQHALTCARDAMSEFRIEKDIAIYIKTEFDKMYKPTWHCIVGSSYGSYVSHESKHFINFCLGEVGILLFKSG